LDLAIERGSALVVLAAVSAVKVDLDSAVRLMENPMCFLLCSGEGRHVLQQGSQGVRHLGRHLRQGLILAGETAVSTGIAGTHGETSFPVLERDEFNWPRKETRAHAARALDEAT
jgi:hypothetical protein